MSDLRGSLTAHATDILRGLVAESTGEEVRFKRESLAEGLRERLDAEVKLWGVTITKVSLA